MNCNFRLGQEIKKCIIGVEKNEELVYYIFISKTWVSTKEKSIK